MKILSLNLWGGRRFEKLMPFIREKAGETDVFCFQEMIDGGPAASITSLGIRGNLYEEMAHALSDFQGFKFMRPAPASFHKEAAESGISWGLALFVKKGLTITAHGSGHLYSSDFKEADTISFGTGGVLWAVVEAGNKQITIATVHGLFQEFRADNPSKRDTVERLEQSRRIVELIALQKNPGLVIGDLNLRPETESVAMLAKPMRNLITEYRITNTRNTEYTEMEKWKDYISDYAFTTPDLNVKEFKVLPDLVSDHAALSVSIG